MQTLTIQTSASLRELLGKNQFAQMLQHARLLSEINNLVKVTLESAQAAHCQVLQYKEGVLAISVDSAAFATQLRFAAPELVKSLRCYPLLKELKTIQFRVQPVTTVKSQPTRQASALSEAAADLIKDTAMGISDPQLQKALLRLAKNTR